jgi:hypothetical protein
MMETQTFLSTRTETKLFTLLMLDLVRIDLLTPMARAKCPLTSAYRSHEAGGRYPPPYSRLGRSTRMVSTCFQDTRTFTETLQDSPKRTIFISSRFNT